jgi:RNA polymerase sigma factor (sigma-70 family)
LDDLNSRQFVDRLRRGDTDAFEILFDRLVPKLCGYLTKQFLLVPHDAEEIASDVMLKVHKSVATHYAFDKGKLTTWVIQVGHNTAIDLIRKRIVRQEKYQAAATDNLLSDSTTKKELSYELDYSEEQAEDSSSGATIHKIKAAFESLSESDRDILRMREVMEYDEIAEVENITVNAARVRYSRAMERLQAAYEKEKNDGQ